MCPKQHARQTSSSLISLHCSRAAGRRGRTCCLHVSAPPFQSRFGRPSEAGQELLQTVEPLTVQKKPMCVQLRLQLHPRRLKLIRRSAARQQKTGIFGDFRHGNGCDGQPLRLKLRHERTIETESELFSFLGTWTLLIAPLFILLRTLL